MYVTTLHRHLIYKRNTNLSYTYYNNIMKQKITNHALFIALSVVTLLFFLAL